MNKKVIILSLTALFFANAIIGSATFELKNETNFFDDGNESFDWVEVIDQEQTVCDGYYLLIGSNPYLQSFKPSMTPLCRVDLDLRCRFSEGGSLHFSIREQYDGEDLVSETISFLPSEGGWFSFDFDDFEVVPEQTYYIVVSADIAYEYGWCKNSNNPYDRGALTYYYGEEDPETDMLFITYSRIENNPPETPVRPSGLDSGQPGNLYTYSTSTSDNDSQDIYYLWDWGDGTNSGWLGPYLDDEVCEQTKSWSSKGTYEVKVKARDEWGSESEWSDPLPVTMPRQSLDISNIFFEWGLKSPRLMRFLGRLQSFFDFEKSVDSEVEYWGLLVAVGEYLNHPEQDRPSMLVEVDHLYQTLLEKQNWDAGHIRKLTGSDATLFNIIEGFRWLNQMENENDICLVYITTHGGYLDNDYPPFDESDGKDEILTPYEGFDDPSNFLWDDELNFFFSLMDSEGLCFIVDSCYSGGFNDEDKEIVKPLSCSRTELWASDFLEVLNQDMGRVILMSSQEDQVSYGSHFSYYVAEGFGGAADENDDSFVSAEEAFEYAEPYIVDIGLQNPTVVDTYDGFLQLIAL